MTRHGFTALLVLALQLPAEAGTAVRGWVSWVMDGDTVMLVPEGGREPLKLRIEGIDAPESCQPGGQAARDALIRLVHRKPVVAELRAEDVYGRQIGRLSLDGQDVGAEMVRSGMAWAYSHRTGRGPYAGLQRQAQREQRGVFAGSAPPMVPGVFRRFHGSCHPEEEGLPPVQRVPQTGQAGSRPTRMSVHDSARPSSISSRPAS